MRTEWTPEQVSALEPLADPFDRWMVRSNLERIAAGEVEAPVVVATLRAGGYERVADAVEQLG